MSDGMNIRLRLAGGTWIKIKVPNGFNIQRYNLTKSGRIANGDMTMDFIAKKRKFLFSYESISKKDFNDILNIVDTTTMFFEIQYVENDVTKTATVYAGHIPSERFRTDMGWYWKDVNFDLIEV